MGLFFNFLVGVISRDCGIPESEVTSALAYGGKEMENFDPTPLRQAILNYRTAWNWRKKKESIWQIYHHYRAKYGKL